MMRTATALLSFSLSLCFVGCDIPGPVDDDALEREGFESASTSGGDEDPSASDSAVTGASPTAGSSDSASTSGSSDTAGIVCEDLDLSPADGEYEWGCYCDSCELDYPNISVETLDAFDGSDGSLCECLCAAAGCGGVEGEGGVTTGDDSGDGDETASTGGSGDGGDTASTGGSGDGDGDETASTGDPGDSDSDSGDYPDGSGETGVVE